MDHRAPFHNTLKRQDREPFKNRLQSMVLNQLRYTAKFLFAMASNIHKKKQSFYRVIDNRSRVAIFARLENRAVKFIILTFLSLFSFCDLLVSFAPTAVFSGVLWKMSWDLLLTYILRRIDSIILWQIPFVLLSSGFTSSSRCILLISASLIVSVCYILL